MGGKGLSSTDEDTKIDGRDTSSMEGIEVETGERMEVRV